MTVLYRTAVIGCGKIGATWSDSHRVIYQQCARTELVALCDIDLWKIPWGYQEYTDYMDMVTNEKLDIVSVCTPPETHCQIVCDIAPFVKGIYCEKPIATTLEDADKMIEVCRKHNVVLQVNHQRRFYKPVFTFSRGILNSGSHAFDLVNYLFKPEIEVDFTYIDTNEYRFELDCIHEHKSHVPVEAVEHLIECIETNKQNKSSGEDAREALRQCLELQEILKIS